MRTQMVDRDEPQKSLSKMKTCIFAHSMYCIKHLGDNDSEGNAILENFLPFIWPAVHSEQTKEGEKDKRQREKKRRKA